MIQKLRQVLTIGLLAQMVVATNFATAAQAGMITTESAIASAAADANRQSLLAELAREDVRAEIVALGVDPAEAEARLLAMTDQEVTEALAQIDEGTAGGDVIGFLLAVFLILILTDLLCITNLFTFTRCSR